MSFNAPNLTFVVGEEKRLAEIISRAEIESLLRSLIKAGPVWSAVLDEDGLPICRQGGDHPLDTLQEIRHSLLVEGEPRGTLVVAIDPPLFHVAEPLALLARDALQMTVTNNLKRMLTTEIHTSVVQESYEQLVETNRTLAESERRYRELALSLEREVEERTNELQKAYSRVLQQEKLAAVGGLAAGMAHEINNPNGFILSNLTTFKKYLERVTEMLGFYRLLASKEITSEQLLLMTEARWRELKLDFVLDDARDLLYQSMQGAERISKIVADLKSFSHVDETGESDADLNVELKRTLSVLTPSVVPGTIIVQDLQPLPLFACNPGLLSQAFLNVIQNTLQSRVEGLEVRISSHCEAGEIVITIADNGCGIPADNLTRVFEPFFTTRDVGGGTGMGLVVAREIVRGSGGNIEIMSSEQLGTTVVLRLPLAPGKD